MNTMVFDIETVPDVELGRRLYPLAELDDQDVAKAMFFRRLQESGTEFLQHYQHRIVAISIVLRDSRGLKVLSLGDRDSTEKELISDFFKGVQAYSPQLVSWNGGGFDLPADSICRFCITGRYCTGFRRRFTGKPVMTFSRSAITIIRAAITSDISMSWMCWPDSSRERTRNSMRSP